MQQHHKKVMVKLNKIASLLCILFTLTSCVKEDVETNVPVEDSMLFGVKGIAQTRIDYSGESDNRVTAMFEKGDNIGLYAFYNNFYYYFSEYMSFAESVIFTNQGLTVDGNNNATYSPVRSWTFSTIYGTAPHTLDCVAYYPFREGYNTTYVHVTNDNNGKATLEYLYAYEGVVNANVDFMTAYTRYDDSLTPDRFRDDMLALQSIPLSFTRRCASLNLKVTKPKGYTTDIIVTEVTVYFDAFTKFTQTIGSDSVISWVDMTSDYALEASAFCNVNLIENTWNNTPGQGATNKADNLLEYDNMLHFPPETQINKIVFVLTDDGVSKNYTWHPHLAPIEANTNYTLNLELDPQRAN